MSENHHQHFAMDETGALGDASARNTRPARQTPRPTSRGGICMRIPLLIAGPLLAILVPAAMAHSFADADSGSDSSDFKIIVLPGGTEMEYSGRIAFGASSALRSSLNDNPGVKILHLNSNGGSVYWARQMQAIVEDRGLTTVIDGHCLSACALIFVVGQERYMAPGARLGFHRESAAGESQAEIDMFEETDAQHMKALGISSSFVDKVFSTPSSDIWIPTLDELKAAHVITGGAGKFTTPDDLKLPANLAEQMLAENPFKLLQSRDPDRFKSMRQHAVLAMGSHASQADLESLPTKDIAPLAFTYWPHASDALAIDFGQALETYFIKLGRKNPEECYFILYPARAPTNFVPIEVLSVDELAEFADLQARLVSDGALRNAAVPSESDIRDARDAMSQLFREKNPDLVSTLSELDSDDVDHERACSAVTQMLARTLDLPVAQKGPLLRYIFQQS